MSWRVDVMGASTEAPYVTHWHETESAALAQWRDLTAAKRAYLPPSLQDVPVVGIVMWWDAETWPPSVPYGREHLALNERGETFGEQVRREVRETLLARVPWVRGVA